MTAVVWLAMESDEMNPTLGLDGDATLTVRFVCDPQSIPRVACFKQPAMRAAHDAAVSLTQHQHHTASQVECSDIGGSPWLMCFGDPHGRFQLIRETVRRWRPKAIILLGDICADKPLHEELFDIVDLTEVWFIHGNHDSDEERWWSNISSRLLGTPLANRNLSGRVCQVAGRKVAGLGGVFYGKVWNPRDGVPSLYERPEDLIKEQRRGLMVGVDWQARLRSGIFRGVYKDLAAQEADVLVTHEGPSLHVHGSRVLDELASAMKVKLLVHGHHHHNLAYPPSSQEPWRGYCVDEGSALAVYP